MTESGGISTANPALPASQYVLGSCGTPVPGTEIKVKFNYEPPHGARTCIVLDC